MSVRGVVSWVVSLVLVGAGVALIAVFVLDPFGAAPSQGTATNEAAPGGFNVPALDGAQSAEADVGGPEDKTLEITVPGMSRVENVRVPSAPGNDAEVLRENAAIHLEGTGFPWQDEANVYVAGHRLGFPNTDSFLAFYDILSLEEGDRIFVSDADGNEYTYEVFDEFVVSPTAVHVTDVKEGRNILTLQTCTLPDYSERLVVQAELVDTVPA